MLIRQEEPRDHDRVTAVVKEAFESAEHSDGKEHHLVKALRMSEAFLPELSLVAEADGQVVGHIMFTRAKAGSHTVLALAPLSVLPGYQRKGIGSALIAEGHQIARELGYHYSVVVGSEAYYPRHGYLPADTLGITPPFDVPGENFMACRLMESAPDIHGRIQYAKEFGIG